MAMTLTCDNCGDEIADDDVRWHLDILVPGAGPNKTMGATSRDLCSKGCVLQCDKNPPVVEEPMFVTPIEPGPFGPGVAEDGADVT